jgi:tetratricopeptide (TPR) repeat protein
VLELHRYAKNKDKLKDKIIFYPCGQPDTEGFNKQRLLCIIGYSQCISAYAFRRLLGVFLSGADLREADLSRAYLSGADLMGADLMGADLSRAYLSEAHLSRADLSRAYLFRADLREVDLREADLFRADLSGADLREADLFRADLREANLFRADLSGADLSGGDLSGANLSGANLEAIKWQSETKWTNATGLHEAVGISLELAQNPTFSAAIKLSQGMSCVREGNVDEAIQAYNQALSIDPNVEISAYCWNSLCWFGSLHGRAADVLYACENAMNLEPEPNVYQVSRGLGRALTGDLPGALADFQAVLNSDALDFSDDVKQQRQRWVEALNAGENPFTPEELEALREAEGL